MKIVRIISIGIVVMFVSATASLTMYPAWAGCTPAARGISGQGTCGPNGVRAKPVTPPPTQNLAAPPKPASGAPTGTSGGGGGHK
jgi:hypothetical protein